MERLIEQANAEKELNLAYEDGSEKKKWGEFNKNTDAPGVNQRVWMLPNKGKVFLDILAKHNYVDCVKEIVGDEFLVSSFGANIAKPGGVAMDLHTDQWWFPDPVNRNDDFLPPGSIKRNKFNIKINQNIINNNELIARPAVTNVCLLYTSPSPRDGLLSRMPSSA